jgi:UDP-N-acetyl-D-glucosamine dehydrogenase
VNLMNEPLPPAAQDLLRRIESRSATVGVIGLGYVGLPLAVEFAKAGFTTIGFDVDAGRVARVNASQSYVGDVGASELEPLIGSGKLRAAAPGDEIGKCDAISICVPTPLRKSKDPDISYIVSATREVSQRIRPGQLIVLESTTYPGTTTEVLQPELERRGMKAGTDFFLAFSPERVDPGNPVYNTKNTPKVIGGLTAACRKLCYALYSSAVDRVVPVSSPAAAEMVKLLENTFRSVNIGLVNEMAIMCRKLGCDVWEVIEAAATKPFGFMPFFPGPGLGGHCIPIDPLYLSWKLKTLNYNARFIELAGEINSHMPDHVADLAAQALNATRRSVNGSRVLVLGVAYKRNVSDYRESPALDIMELLRKQGAEVEYSDPHVPEVRLDGTTTRSVPCDERHLGGADLVVVVTDHAAFDPKLIAACARVVLDTRNLLKGLSGPARIVRL